MSAEIWKHQASKDPRLKEATISEEREDVWENLREKHRTGNRKADSRIFCRVTKNQELDIVEGSSPSETEEDPTRSFSVRRAGNVVAPATRDGFAPTPPFGKKKPMDRLAP
jgi:hypothetical protein